MTRETRGGWLVGWLAGIELDGSSPGNRIFPLGLSYALSPFFRSPFWSPLAHSLARSLARPLDCSLFFARWFIIPLRSASCEFSSRATLLARPFSPSYLLPIPSPKPHIHHLCGYTPVPLRFAHSPPPRTEGCGGGFSSLAISSSDVPYHKYCIDATREMF